MSSPMIYNVLRNVRISRNWPNAIVIDIVKKILSVEIFWLINTILKN
jgi:hypothetical protein